MESVNLVKSQQKSKLFRLTCLMLTECINPYSIFAFLLSCETLSFIIQFKFLLELDMLLNSRNYILIV